MQLLSELPVIVGMFLCGALGFFLVDVIKKKATANLRDQKKPKKLEDDFQHTDATPSNKETAEHPAKGAESPPASANSEVAAEQAQAPLNPRVERLLAKKAARKARKAAEAAAAAKEESAVAASIATVLCEAPIDGTPADDADAGEAMPRVGNSVVARESTAEVSSAKEQLFPSNCDKENSDSGSVSTDEATRQGSGFRPRRRTSRWADDESGDEWELDEEERQQLLDDLDEEERCRLLGEFPDTTDSEGFDWEGAWSEDEDVAVAAARILEGRLKDDGSFPASHGKPNRRSRRSRDRKRRRNRAKKRHVNDNWMTPFSNLLMGDASVTPFPLPRLAPIGLAGAASPRAPLVMQTFGQPLLPPLPSPVLPELPVSAAHPVVPPMPGQLMVAPSMKPVLPTVNSTSAAVCIWNTTSPSASTTCAGGDPQDVFTDGSQVFKSVPSTTGQPLFTDGKQLYASVCVMMGAPPSSEAAELPPSEPSPEPSSMMDCCGTVDEHSGANLISYMATSDEDNWD